MKQAGHEVQLMVWQRNAVPENERLMTAVFANLICFVQTAKTEKAVV